MAAEEEGEQQVDGAGCGRLEMGGGGGDECIIASCVKEEDDDEGSGTGLLGPIN